MAFGRVHILVVVLEALSLTGHMTSATSCNISGAIQTCVLNKSGIDVSSVDELWVKAEELQVDVLSNICRSTPADATTECAAMFVDGCNTEQIVGWDTVHNTFDAMCEEGNLQAFRDNYECFGRTSVAQLVKSNCEAPMKMQVEMIQHSGIPPNEMAGSICGLYDGMETCVERLYQDKCPDVTGAAMNVYHRAMEPVERLLHCHRTSATSCNIAGAIQTCVLNKSDIDVSSVDELWVKAEELQVDVLSNICSSTTADATTECAAAFVDGCNTEQIVGWDTVRNTFDAMCEKGNLQAFRDNYECFGRTSVAQLVKSNCEAPMKMQVQMIQRSGVPPNEMAGSICGLFDGMKTCVERLYRDKCPDVTDAAMNVYHRAMEPAITSLQCL